MKKLITLLLCLSMILSINTIALASSDVKIKVNGTQLSDAQAILKDSATLLPVRSVSTALGCEVIWDNETKTASIDKDDTSVNITIGQKELTVNGKKQTISTPAQIISGRTYVPLRALGEALECDITWVNVTKTVEISQVAPSKYKAWYEVDETGRLYIKTNINSDKWNGYTMAIKVLFRDGSYRTTVDHGNGLIQDPCRAFYSHLDAGTIHSTSLYIFKGTVHLNSSRGNYDKAISANADKFVGQFSLDNRITIIDSDQAITFSDITIQKDPKHQREIYTVSIAEPLKEQGEYDILFETDKHYDNVDHGHDLRIENGKLKHYGKSNYYTPSGVSGTFYITHCIYSADEKGNIVLNRTISNGIDYDFPQY